MGLPLEGKKRKGTSCPRLEHSGAGGGGARWSTAGAEHGERKVYITCRELGLELFS